jgi:hypothetical protein
MSNPLSAARAAVGAVLDGIGVPVHLYPPANPTGPYITILPDSPWLTPKGHVRLQITVNTPNLNNAATLERVEQTTSDVLAALQGIPFGVGEVTAPTIDPTSNLLTAIVPVLTRP